MNGGSEGVTFDELLFSFSLDSIRASLIALLLLLLAFVFVALIAPPGIPWLRLRAAMMAERFIKQRRGCEGVQCIVQVVSVRCSVTAEWIRSWR